MSTVTFDLTMVDGARSARPLPRAPLQEWTDTALARAAVSGDSNAFGEIVRRYQDRIYTIVRSHCREDEEALDLTQEIFIKTYQRLATFREGATFYTWLYRIAINACIDAARQRKRRQPPASLDDQVLAECGYEPEDARVGSNPERQALNEEMGTLVQRWIRSLPELQRDAILLSDVHGLSQEDVAAVLHCPLGTAKSRIQRGRMELRRRLQHYLRDDPAAVTELCEAA